jgi:hypothetical protein
MNQARQTSQQSVSLKTDSPAKRGKPVSLSMIPKQEGCEKAKEKPMWMRQPQSLFRAIRKVETGGHKDPTNAIGDDGASLGPFQISEAYWKDAITHMPELGGTYQDVKGDFYAQLVMMAYWDRYAEDDSYETLARIHNGGPNGHRLAATDYYWAKVRLSLDTLTSGLAEEFGANLEPPVEK